MGSPSKKRKAKPSSGGGRIGEFFRSPRRKAVPAGSSRPKAKGGKISSFFEQSRKTVLKRQRSMPTATRKSPRKQVTKKPVQRVRIPDPVVLAARIEREQVQAQYDRAVVRFKPRKSELGTVVFLSARPPKGRSERLERRSRKKGYAVYITRSGKLEPLREAKGQPPVPRKRASLDPARFRRKSARVAGQKSLFARVSTRRALGRTLTPRGKRASVDWLAVQRQLAGAMSRGMQTERRAHTQVVDHQVVVRTKDGTMRTFSATTNLHVSDQQAQMIPGPDWSGFAGKVSEAYGLIAEQLKAADMVSRGSAEYISKLDVNEDVDEQALWLGEDGNRWEKNKCAIVDIVSWSFEVGVGVIEG